MRVKVNYVSVLGAVTGKKEEKIEVGPGTSIEKLVEILVGRYGQRFADMVYMTASPRKYLVNFWLNGEIMEDNYILNDGDELTILIGLGGG